MAFSGGRGHTVVCVHRASTSSQEERLDTFLNVLANAGSYGIFPEMNREELPASQEAEVTVFGTDRAFTCRTRAPEMPGPFCFPPISALIPAAARLMLALLERWRSSTAS